MFALAAYPVVSSIAVSAFDTMAANVEYSPTISLGTIVLLGSIIMVVGTILGIVWKVGTWFGSLTYTVENEFKRNKEDHERIQEGVEKATSKIESHDKRLSHLEHRLRNDK